MATTKGRGYGSLHKLERRRWTDWLARGNSVQCACTGDCRREIHPHTGRCPTMITSASTWDLGHNADRTGYVGPECVPCNRSRGARNSNRPHTLTVRDW